MSDSVQPHRLYPRHAHGDLTSLAPHERLPEILVVPRENTPRASDLLDHPVESTSWDLNSGICCLPWSVNVLLPAFCIFSELYPAASGLCLVQPVLPAVPTQGWKKRHVTGQVSVFWQCSIRQIAPCLLKAYSVWRESE